MPKGQLKWKRWSEHKRFCLKRNPGEARGECSKLKNEQEKKVCLTSQKAEEEKATVQLGILDINELELLETWAKHRYKS